MSANSMPTPLQPSPLQHVQSPEALAQFVTRALALLSLYFQGDTQRAHARVQQLLGQLTETGDYTLSADELSFGVKRAWEREARCVGNFYYKTAVVRDARAVQTTGELHADLEEHLTLTQGRQHRQFALITCYGGHVQIENGQLNWFAGWAADENRPAVGDPRRAVFTQVCQRFFGYDAEPQPFAFLPLLCSVHGRPAALTLQNLSSTALRSSRYPALDALGLRWANQPAITLPVQVLDRQYTTVFTAPFLSSEPAVNLLARDAYHLAPAITAVLKREVARLETVPGWNPSDESVMGLMEEIICESFQAAGIHLSSVSAFQKAWYAYHLALNRAGTPGRTDLRNLLDAGGARHFLPSLAQLEFDASPPEPYATFLPRPASAWYQAMERAVGTPAPQKQPAQLAGCPFGYGAAGG